MRSSAPAFMRNICAQNSAIHGKQFRSPSRSSRLAEGDLQRAVLFGANFGRDADTIATMVGGLCGAYRGTAGLPAPWIEKVEANPNLHYRDLAAKLSAVVQQRAAASARYAENIRSLLSL